MSKGKVKQCVACGKRRLMAGRRKFCDNACKQAAYRMRRGFKMYYRNCEWCISRFSIDSVQAITKTYCSDACKQAAYRIRKDGPSVLVGTCVVCEEQYAITRKDQRYCGTACKSKAARQRRKRC